MHNFTWKKHFVLDAVAVILARNYFCSEFLLNLLKILPQKMVDIKKFIDMDLYGMLEIEMTAVEADVSMH